MERGSNKAHAPRTTTKFPCGSDPVVTIPRLGVFYLIGLTTLLVCLFVLVENATVLDSGHFSGLFITLIIFPVHRCVLAEAHFSMLSEAST